MSAYVMIGNPKMKRHDSFVSRASVSRSSGSITAMKRAIRSPRFCANVKIAMHVPQ